MVSAWLFWNPLAYQDSQLSAEGRRTTSFGATTLVSAWLLWNLQDSQLSAQRRRMTSFGATTFVSAELFWNPSTYQDSQLIPSSRPKIGGRPPLELQLWSLLGCFGILQDSQLSAQGRRTTSFGATNLVSALLLWNPSAYQDSQLSTQGRRTTSFGATASVSARLLWNPSVYQDSQLSLKLGGRPPKELQFRPFTFGF